MSMTCVYVANEVNLMYIYILQGSYGGATAAILKYNMKIIKHSGRRLNSCLTTLTTLSG